MTWDINCPLSQSKAERLMDALGLQRGSKVLDAGCGTGEFLIQLVERSGSQGVGMDRDAAALAVARELAAGRLVGDAVEFQEADMSGSALPKAAFDVALCLGSTHAFGMGETAYPNALQALSDAVRPGGLLLLGEGYWKQDPAPGYLQLLGEPCGLYHTHAENVAFAEGRGLVPMYATVSNDDEWDHFEWSHRMKVEREAAQHPGDEAWAEKLRRSRVWRDGYLRWGRTTMGFGFYLFMKPESARA